MKQYNRRSFVRNTLLTVAAMPVLKGFPGTNEEQPAGAYASRLPMKYALSQWALNRMQFGASRNDMNSFMKLLSSDPDKLLQGSLKPMDFPAFTRKTFNLEAVEYVNTFFYGHGDDTAFMKQLKKRSEDAGIRNLLIMVDAEGYLGHADKKERADAIERHKKWLESAAILGCHSIRVNAHGTGGKEDQKFQAADSLAKLCDLAQKYQLNILVENHGGMSSHPIWLLETLKEAGKSNLGTCVDFDNFDYSETKIYDGELRYNRYVGVDLLMPLAKSVSAKAHRFDDQGFETSIDFERMVKIIGDHNYTGYISLEYEGNHQSEVDGIKSLRALLDRYQPKI
ncbi:sugar phosphate isomerase/epimerase [Flavihumibacter rivuli]|uniref:sugar phosphate isomerase/epimerase family protein n=1 Tax=Flavihumibacter rivuli TaxID=2838156 RepID=UPI001BDE271D|nr:sugar phosphate isomerase/epimerase family protein [Flavihumibacter rivuli]ULQ55997.1 sugar phosphate isomerase/epimerase [Flavihumibacter rivuli]